MSKLRSRLGQLHRDEDGAALVEYTVLVGLLIGAVLLSVIAVGGWVGTQWTTFNGLVNP
jgi:pilus assembly protein Flp/PilA